MRGGLSFNATFDKQSIHCNPVNNINVNVAQTRSVDLDGLDKQAGTADNDITVAYANASSVVYPNGETACSNASLTNSEALCQELNKQIESLNQQIEASNSCCEALKIIIDMMKSNPIIINKLIVADDEKLSRLVLLLTNASEVIIDAEDLGAGCFTGHTYRKVNAIYVIKDGKAKNLKYDFPDVMKTLKDLGINTKIVW